MVEAIILSLATSIAKKIASFTGDLALTTVTKHIKAVKSAKNDLKIIANKLVAICAVLEDAEQKQYKNKAINIWLQDLKSVAYDIDDLLDKVATDALMRSIQEGHVLPRLRYFLSCLNLSHKIRSLREELDNIVAKKNEFGLTERPVEFSINEIRDPFDKCDYVCESAILGRDEAKEDIIKRILKENSSGVSSGLSVLPIVGMGGIGKTALAKLVHKDISQYFDINLWACVSDEFDIRRIIEDILKSGGHHHTTLDNDLGSLVRGLHILLDGKKYFLVLDDVWKDDIAAWTELKNMLAVGKAGSVILITTRNTKVASITGTIEPAYNLDRLPNPICWSIFKQLAFKEGEDDRFTNLGKIGKSIVEKCGGIPLVVRTLGSLLRTERDEREWERIRDLDSFVDVHGGQYDKIMQLLKLSYDNLPSHLKACFAHLSLFPKNVDFATSYVPYMWSALGLLQVGDNHTDIEGYGYKYFMELISMSLLQEPTIQLDGMFCECKIHDLMHDLVVKMMGKELAYNMTQDTLIVSEDTRHISWGNEGYDRLKDKKFPEQFSKATKVRTFRFGYRMNHISHSFLEGIISSMTCLRILDLGGCLFEELPKSIGELKHLRYLSLLDNSIISYLPITICKLVNLETFQLDGCEQLKELPKDVFHLKSLKRFGLTTLQTSLIGMKFNELNSLQSLEFESCKRLLSLWESADVGRLTSIRTLYITNCPKLIRFPNSMKNLIGLDKLILTNCEELELEKGEGFQGLQSLRVLYIENLPKLKYLPFNNKYDAPSLRYLTIINCVGLFQLPYWLLHGFSCLRETYISNCPNLSTVHRFYYLSSQTELIIENCPRLPKRRTTNTEEGCSKVQSHS